MIHIKNRLGGEIDISLSSNEEFLEIDVTVRSNAYHHSDINVTFDIPIAQIKEELDKMKEDE